MEFYLKPGIVYLATGYCSKVPFIGRVIEWLRFRRVTMVTAYWMRFGYNIFSPITHSHSIQKHLPDEFNVHDFWMPIDYVWIDMCSELWVYMQKGWENSVGVGLEVDYAQSKGMTVRYIDTNMNFVEPKVGK